MPMTLCRCVVPALALASVVSLATLGCDGGPELEDTSGDDIVLYLVEDALPSPEDFEPTGDPCYEAGTWAMCRDDASVAFCDSLGAGEAEGELVYGECIPVDEVECLPGEAKTVPTDGCGEITITCIFDAGVPIWELYECEPSPETPLVLRFDDAPIEMIDAEAHPAATFDISMAADGSSCITTDWPSPATPWLAVDLDGSGTIDGGHELFGSGTRLGSDQATNGFVALAPFDANDDGVVDARDPRFAELLLWRDFDGDRRSSPGELSSVAESGVASLSLDYAIASECDERGNCGLERASFATTGGGRGEIVDLHLSCH